jgi:hypothetical protein
VLKSADLNREVAQRFLRVPARASPSAFISRLHSTFGGKLSGDNRWIKLAEIIPWNELEDYYAVQFCKGFGAHAKPFRMALGALIIKAHLSLTGEELAEQIKENTYLQLFIALAQGSTIAKNILVVNLEKLLELVAMLFTCLLHLLWARESVHKAHSDPFDSQQVMVRCPKSYNEDMSQG